MLESETKSMNSYPNMTVDPNIVREDILKQLVDDRIRFHEIIWSLHTSPYAEKSIDELRDAAITAAISLAEKGLIMVVACTDWKNQKYAPVDHAEQAAVISDARNWDSEKQSEVTYWFDSTPAGESETVRILKPQ